MKPAVQDARELSRFEYPDNPRCMYDPVLRLRVATEPGPRGQQWDAVDIGIHHDAGIEQGRYTMVDRNRDRTVPFRSSRSRRLATLLCSAEDCGDRIRLKVRVDGFAFRSHHLRGSIETLRIPLVSNDVASMYLAVIKAYPGLRALREENFPPSRFPDAATVEICVTTSGLTEGLGRHAGDYPMIEPPVPGWTQPAGRRSASVESASLKDEGWHRVASWPMRLEPETRASAT